MKNVLKALFERAKKFSPYDFFWKHWPSVLGLFILIIGGVWYLAADETMRMEIAANQSIFNSQNQPAAEQTAADYYAEQAPAYLPLSNTLPNLTKKYDLKGMKVEWNDKYEKMDYDKTDSILAKADRKGEYRHNFWLGLGSPAETDQTKMKLSRMGMFLYDAGKIVGGGLDGKELYHWFVPVLPAEGPGPSHEYFLVFIGDDNKLIAVNAGITRSTAFDSETMTSDRFGYLQGSVNIEFPELSFPAKLYLRAKNLVLFDSGSQGAQPFSYTPYTNALGIQMPGFFDYNTKTATEPTVNSPLSEDDFVFNSDEGYKVYNTGGCYKILLPNGAQEIYNLQWNVIGKLVSPDPKPLLNSTEFKAAVKWDRKANQADNYMLLAEPGYCGGSGKCPLDLQSAKWFDTAKLVKIGTTTGGEPVFELSDKATNEFYKSFFLMYSPPDSGEADMTDRNAGKISPSESEKFNVFIADQPIFFWQDPFGRYIGFKKSKYQPYAECGKPVIYLYPEKETDVNVRVEPNGGLTKTEPAYLKDGWNVRATPDSELLNFADNAVYPYLFWEGKAYDMPTPDYGFVLNRANVGTEMKKILGRLGLNEKETNDFLEFWQPKLEVKPYVFVTFIPQNDFDKLAPLKITPKPDKVIRVFMDYTPLEAPISVKPMNIITPERTGFTVVEWGGRLHG